MFRFNLQINLKQIQNYEFICLKKYRNQVNNLFDENVDSINNENRIAKIYT